MTKQPTTVKHNKINTENLKACIHQTLQICINPAMENLSLATRSHKRKRSRTQNTPPTTADDTDTDTTIIAHSPSPPPGMEDDITQPCRVADVQVGDVLVHHGDFWIISRLDTPFGHNRIYVELYNADNPYLRDNLTFRTNDVVEVVKSELSHYKLVAFSWDWEEMTLLEIGSTAGNWIGRHRKMSFDRSSKEGGDAGWCVRTCFNPNPIFPGQRFGVVVPFDGDSWPSYPRDKGKRKLRRDWLSFAPHKVISHIVWWLEPRDQLAMKLASTTLWDKVPWPIKVVSREWAAVPREALVNVALVVFRGCIQSEKDHDEKQEAEKEDKRRRREFEAPLEAGRWRWMFKGFE